MTKLGSPSLDSKSEEKNSKPSEMFTVDLEPSAQVSLKKKKHFKLGKWKNRFLVTTIVVAVMLVLGLLSANIVMDVINRNYSAEGLHELNNKIDDLHESNDKIDDLQHVLYDVMSDIDNKITWKEETTSQHYDDSTTTDVWRMTTEPRWRKNPFAWSQEEQSSYETNYK